MTEYTYSTPIVKDSYDAIRCILAAFNSLAQDAQNTINEFAIQEFGGAINELSITKDEIESISNESLTHNLMDYPSL